MGRFLSVDPVTAYSNPIGSFNRYAYANNNPYRFTDPDGRQACDGISTCRVATEERLVARGQMTQQQKQANDQARGVGAIIGLVSVVAAKVGIDLGFAALANPQAATSVISALGEAAGVTGAAGGGAFMASAMKPAGQQGLTVVGRALQKHAGREGAFSGIKFSHKTANEAGLTALKSIMNSENKVIQQAENGGTLVFDANTRMGYGISRNGLFNGFRELPNDP